MARASRHHAAAHGATLSHATSTAKPRAQSDILIIDDFAKRGEALRQTLRHDGYREPELALSGDEALDVLGAHAQRFDLVIAWMPLVDGGRLDLLKVLRQIGSPLRFACAIPEQKDRFPSPGRLAGATAILYRPEFDTMAVQADVLIQNGDSVADIVATREVPRLLPDVWALAIYGARPGSRFTASLD